MPTEQEVGVTEEVQARRTMIRRAGNDDHSRRHSNELSILINQDPCRSYHTRTSSDDNDWLRCLENEKLANPPAPGNKPKIQKVPERRRKITLDNCKSSYYDPLVVSIGPIHHGKDELQEMEKFKRQLTRKYAEACYKVKGIDMDKVYDRVAEMSESGRRCYADGLTEQYDHTTFARMMFVDGCFVLQYIHSMVKGSLAEMKMKNEDIAFVGGDLLLLENQLPFQILQVLMSCRFNENEGVKMINKFIIRLGPAPPYKRESGLIMSIKNLIRDLCFPITYPELPFHHDSTAPAHLLELLKRRLLKCRTSFSGDHHGYEWLSCPSATELRKVGIYFSPAEYHCFSDIHFKSSFHYATLILPPVVIDESSRSLFMNLVAYEACPDNPDDDFGITSFLCFMDSLIKEAEDVKVLRSKGVVFNLLGSDEDVAEVLKQICRDVVPNPYAYVQVKREIQRHFKYKARILFWITEWKDAHFSSPWTFIAFLATIFFMALNVFQTILTYIQTFKQKSSS